MASSYILNSTEWQGRYMYILCEQEKDISNNKSTINWTLTVTGGSGTAYSTGPTTVTIAGEEVYTAPRIPYTNKVFPAIKGNISGSITVTHNTDGKLSVPVSITTAIFDDVPITTSGTWDLDANPRGAVLNTAPNFNDEESPVITYTNYGGNNVSSIQACITFEGNNADIAYRDISKTSGTYTFNLTDAERKKLRQYSANAYEKQIGFYLKTVVDGLTFYSKMWRSFYIVNAAPTLAPTIEDTNTTTLALTGDKNKIIKGYNTIKFNNGATLKKEATVASQNVTCGSVKASAASGTIANVESNVFKFALYDSRGAYVEQTVTKTLIDYVKLTNNLTVTNPTTDGVANVTVKGNFFNGSFGAVANTLTVEYRMKQDNKNFTEWKTSNKTPTISGNTYTLSTSFNGLNYLSSYIFEFRVTDKLNTITKSKTVKTTPVYDWSDEDFNFNVPVSIKGVEIDYIVEQGSNNGWEYRKWNSGRAECWKSVTLTTAATTTWGVLWKGDSYIERQTYPFNFAEKPIENVTIQSGSIGSWALAADGGNGVNGASASARYTVCRPASTNSTEYYFSFYVIGKWK